MPSSTALSEAVGEFQSALAAYARSLAAEVDVADEASVQRFLRAMGPIDELRSRRNGSTEDEETETEPVIVPVPPAPTDGPVPA